MWSRRGRFVDPKFGRQQLERIRQWSCFVELRRRAVVNLPLGMTFELGVDVVDVEMESMWWRWSVRGIRKAEQG